MFSEEDLDKDLFLCQIYCVWIYFGSVSALSPICTQNSRFFSFSFFFFAVWAQEESMLDIFDSYQKQDLTSSCSELNVVYVFLPSLSDFLQCPSSVLPPSFSALIFFWIAFQFPFTVLPTMRGIAVMAHTRKWQRWPCGLAAASRRAVHTEHLTYIRWVGVWVLSPPDSLSHSPSPSRAEAAAVAKGWAP